MWDKKKIQMNLKKQKKAHRLRDRIYGYRGKGGDKRDRLGVWDRHVHTVLFKMVNQQGPTVEHRELCSIFCKT